MRGVLWSMGDNQRKLASGVGDDVILCHDSESTEVPFMKIVDLLWCGEQAAFGYQVASSRCDAMRRDGFPM